MISYWLINYIMCTNEALPVELFSSSTNFCKNQNVDRFYPTNISFPPGNGCFPNEILLISGSDYLCMYGCCVKGEDILVI